MLANFKAPFWPTFKNVSLALPLVKNNLLTEPNTDQKVNCSDIPTIPFGRRNYFWFAKQRSKLANVSVGLLLAYHL